MPQARTTPLLLAFGAILFARSGLAPFDSEASVREQLIEQLGTSPSPSKIRPRMLSTALRSSPNEPSR